MSTLHTGVSKTASIIGARINVTATTDLATLDVGGLTIGTRVYALDAAADFILSISTATVDHVTVEAVDGYTGLRWLSSSTGGFGSDTIVDLPNSNSANVSALELIASLTSNTAGAEASKWVIKLLTGGAQTTALDLRPAQVLLPTASQAAPSYAFQAAPDTGMYYLAGTAITFAFGGVAQFFIEPTGVATASGHSYFVNTDALRGMGTPDLANIMLFSNGDMQMGADGALATNAVVGFLDIPTCAGAPTGTRTNVRTGKAAIVYDSTNNQLYVGVGNGSTWKKTAVLT